MELLWVWVLAAALAAQQAPEAVFQTGVSLVRVDAQVYQGDRIVEGLTKSDFMIRDNGKPRKILYFNDESDPVDLVLVIDTSRSMRPAIEEAGKAASQALGALRPGDRVAVLRFTTRSHVVQDFTEDRAAISDAITGIISRDFTGGTHIHGALRDAAALLSKQPRGSRRRAILIVTDGESPTVVRERTVLSNLWEADAVVNALLVQAPPRRSGRFLSLLNPRSSPFRVNLPRICEQTGGEALRSSAPGQGFLDLMERIRRRYTLHYAPPDNQPGAHEVKIELTRNALSRYKGATVRSRKGYIQRAAR